MDFADQTDLIGEGLACRRGDRLVFAGLDCRLPAGGALVLTGRNGSGKTSLLRLLATLLVPVAGQLRWGGSALAQDMAHYRGLLHYIGHLDAAKPALRPREMLGFWASLRGETRPAVDRAIELFGLNRVADWPCRWLSAGQRRRLALARLVSVPAPIWLLDEPTAALDSDAEARLVALIAEHRAAGGRVALATHRSLDLPAAIILVLDNFAAAPEAAEW